MYCKSEKSLGLPSSESEASLSIQMMGCCSYKIYKPGTRSLERVTVVRNYIFCESL